MPEPDVWTRLILLEEEVRQLRAASPPDPAPPSGSLVAVKVRAHDLGVSEDTIRRQATKRGVLFKPFGRYLVPVDFGL